MPLKAECWSDSFMIFQRIRASVTKEPYSFVIFQEGTRAFCPLDPHMNRHKGIQRDI